MFYHTIMKSIPISCFTSLTCHELPVQTEGERPHRYYSRKILKKVNIHAKFAEYVECAVTALCCPTVDCVAPFGAQLRKAISRLAETITNI